MHALPTERSRDTRTQEEIDQLIPWVRRLRLFNFSTLMSRTGQELHREVSVSPSPGIGTRGSTPVQSYRQ